MKKNKLQVYIVLISFSFTFMACIYAKDDKNEIMETFDIEKVHFYKSTQNLKIVVFMPSLYIDSEYASMLTTSLNYYFKEGLSFKQNNKTEIDVILVVNNYNKWQKDSIQHSQLFKHPKNQNKLENISVHYDEQGLIFKSLGLDTFKTSAREIPKEGSIITSSLFKPFKTDSLRNESSRLYLLDENNNILLKDTNYRAQGEHLKQLENRIKKHLNIEEINTTIDINKSLKVGDKAPSIILKNIPIEIETDLQLAKDKWNILKDTTSLKVITFYPAPFSGILPDFTENDNLRLLSCAVHIPSFDNSYGKNVKTFAISSSKNKLLDLWRNALRTFSIIYLNDEDYTISKNYNAYNSKGFNNRVTYLIDKKGIIRYIDTDYTLDDQKELQNKIKEYSISSQNK